MKEIEIIGPVWYFCEFDDEIKIHFSIKPYEEIFVIRAANAFIIINEN